jgi:hypothetical protein
VNADDEYAFEYSDYYSDYSSGHSSGYSSGGMAKDHHHHHLHAPDANIMCQLEPFLITLLVYPLAVVIVPTLGSMALYGVRVGRVFAMVRAAVQ